MVHKSRAAASRTCATVIPMDSAGGLYPASSKQGAPTPLTPHACYAITAWGACPDLMRLGPGLADLLDVMQLAHRLHVARIDGECPVIRGLGFVQLVQLD